MKKLLMGLFAISTATFSDVNLGNPAADLSNIFQTGQTGLIAVDGKLVSTIPVVKYVVYASNTGDFTTDADEKLVLPTFVLSQDASTNIMEGVAKKIYVKRVVGNATAELESTDKVAFLGNGFDSFYTAHTADKVNMGGSSSYPMTAFINKTELEGIATAVFGAELNPRVNEYGEITITVDGTDKFYRTPNGITFEQKEQGILTITSATRAGYENSNTMGAENAKKVETQFSSAKTSTISVGVVVE